MNGPSENAVNAGMRSMKKTAAPVMPSHAFFVSLPTAVNASARCRSACTNAYAATGADTIPITNSTSVSRCLGSSTGPAYVRRDE